METYLIAIPVLLFSVVVHEVAHGISAERCGDATARMMRSVMANFKEESEPKSDGKIPLSGFSDKEHLITKLALSRNPTPAVATPYKKIDSLGLLVALGTVSVAGLAEGLFAVEFLLAVVANPAVLILAMGFFGHL